MEALEVVKCSGTRAERVERQLGFWDVLASSW